jgi:hypothetical protein
VLGAAGKSLVEWDAGTGKRLRELGPSRAQLNVVRVCQGGKLVVTGGHKADGSRGRLDQVWSLDMGAVADLPPFTAVWHVANASGGRDQVRKAVTTADDESRHQFAVSPDGRFAVLLALGGRVVLPMDLVAGKQLPDLLCSPEAWRAAFTPDGGVLALGKNDGSIDLLEMPGCQKLGSLAAGAGRWRACALAFAPDGRHLALGASATFPRREHKVYVVDLGTAVAGWRPRPAAGR